MFQLRSSVIFPIFDHRLFETIGCQQFNKTGQNCSNNCSSMLFELNSTALALIWTWSYFLHSISWSLARFGTGSLEIMEENLLLLIRNALLRIGPITIAVTCSWRSGTCFRPPAAAGKLSGAEVPPTWLCSFRHDSVLVEESSMNRLKYGCSRKTC